MKRYRIVGLAVLVAVVATAALMFASLGSAKPAATMDKVTLQLKWVPQAQFAGYYAAASKGYYKQFGLDVTLKPGGPDITPEQVVASGQAQFGLDWLPSLLATRDKGGDLVNIAQVFTRSGMTELTWKSSGINTIKKMAGKKVGVWCCGNENELYAALVKNGIDPKSSSSVTIVNQPFDMTLFLQNKVDAAAAMTYNELAQVLETKNPQTGQALHAQRAERDHDGARRDGDARGRRVRPGLVAEGREEPGHREAVPRRVVQGLGVLP